MDPGFSSIFIPSLVVGEVWRTDGKVGPGFSSILNPSRVVGEVWRTEGWTLDFSLHLTLLGLCVKNGVKYGGLKDGPWNFPLYLSFLGLWVKHGMKYRGRNVGPWIFLYSFSLC